MMKFNKFNQYVFDNITKLNKKQLLTLLPAMKKSTSKVVEKLGTLEEVIQKANGQDPYEWAKNRAKDLTKQEKQAIMKEYATKEGDTGSPEVQIAVLTADINKLNEHFKQHPKDKHSNREIQKILVIKGVNIVKLTNLFIRQLKLLVK